MRLHPGLAVAGDGAVDDVLAGGDVDDQVLGLAGGQVGGLTVTVDDQVVHLAALVGDRERATGGHLQVAADGELGQLDRHGGTGSRPLLATTVATTDREARPR